MLAGIVISSIIIGMVFYLFTALNKQVFGYEGTRNQINEYLLLKSDLKRHFEFSNNKIYGIPNGFVVQNDTVTVRFIKEDNLLLRIHDTKIDTISKHLNEMKLDFISDSQNELTDLIRSCNLTLKIENTLLIPHFYSNSSLKDEINQKLIHEF
jgi:hypothetical protein